MRRTEKLKFIYIYIYKNRNNYMKEAKEKMLDKRRRIIVGRRGGWVGSKWNKLELSEAALLPQPKHHATRLLT